MLSRSRFVSSVGRSLFAIAASAFATTAIAQTPPAPATSAAFPTVTGEPDSEPPLGIPMITEQAAQMHPPSPFSGALLERSKLTGDWYGTRTALAAHGIGLDVSSTQFYQGVTSGGLEQDFQYGGRNDYFLHVDGEKAGLWKGAFITLHGETRYGESANSLTGALMPVNLMSVFPKPNGTVSALSGVKLTQFLSEDLLVYGGKLNTFDDFKQPLTGASGLTGFQNFAMMVNPVYTRTVPYSTFGAGFAYLQNMEPVLAGAVFDANNTPTVSGFDTFFDNGVTLFGQATLPTDFFDLPGHQGVSGTYSSGTYRNIAPTAYYDPSAGLVIASPPQTGSWSLAYNFDQALYVSPDNPRQKWGVFGNLGIADNNPSPIRWFASTGISGASPICGRERDSFGLGYFYLGLSSDFKGVAPVVLPLSDEHGFELYYNIQATPWCQITPDIQAISPSRDRSETSFLAGLRAKIDF